jgi:hypothetical protein
MKNLVIEIKKIIKTKTQQTQQNSKKQVNKIIVKKQKKRIFWLS